MTYGTMELIQTVTVGSGGAATIDFTSIPATYSDLVLKTSTRSTRSNTTDTMYLKVNGSSSSYSQRRLYAFGTTVGSDSLTPAGIIIGGTTAATATASTFSNIEIYIPNYTGSTNKSLSSDGVSEDNSASGNFLLLNAGLWSNTAVINQLTLSLDVGTFVQHSTATLYGITRVPAGAKATGGVIYDDSSYWYHVFTSSGTFTPSQNLSCEYVVIAGGGSGCGGYFGGGGGAGGYRTNIGSAASFTNGTPYTITVGAGGTGSGGAAIKGSNSSIAGSGFTTFTATGGGLGGGSAARPTANGGTGGSGGGGQGGNGTFQGFAGTGNEGGYTPVEGYNGGGGSLQSGGNVGAGGGGGGAGGAGGAGNVPSNTGGAGGIGAQLTSFANATFTGVGGYYAGGGAGGQEWNGSATVFAGAGGLGGGGTGGVRNRSAPTAGVVNTGSGGGGSGGDSFATGANGGSGIVIVRYAK